MEASGFNILIMSKCHKWSLNFISCYDLAPEVSILAILPLIFDFLAIKGFWLTTVKKLIELACEAHEWASVRVREI